MYTGWDYVIAVVAVVAALGASGALVVPSVNWLKAVFKLAKVDWKVGGLVVEASHVVAGIVCVIYAIIVEVVAAGVFSAPLDPPGFQALIGAIYLSSQAWYKAYKSAQPPDG